jgi:hypothetical protein
MKHLYNVHPVECQPQWYNEDCEHAPLYIRYATHIGVAILAGSALGFGVFALALVGCL